MLRAPAAAPAPECTADFEYDTSFDTKKRVWTSRIQFPDKEPVKYFEKPADPQQYHSNNEEVCHFALNFLVVLPLTSYVSIGRV
jgi:hypothetical protein